MRSLIALLTVCCLVIGGSKPSNAQSVVAAYGALPATDSVTVSPDGQSFAYIRHSGDSSQVIAQTRTGELLVMVDTSDRRVRSVSWASSDHVVISSASTERVPFFIGRTEVPILDIVNIRSKRVVRALNASDRSSFSAIFGWDIGRHAGQPVIFAQAVTEVSQTFSMDLYRVDLDTGRGRLHLDGAQDTRNYIVGQDGSVPARIAYNPENGRWRLSARSNMGGWRDIYTLQASLDVPSVFGFGRSRDTIAVSEEVDGEWRLAEISLEDGVDRKYIDLPSSPNRVYHDATGVMVGIGFNDTYQDYEFFEPRLKAAWILLKESLPGKQLLLSSYSDDLNVIVFYVEGTGEPGSYFQYDVAARQVSLIGRAYPELSGADISEVRIINYKAADGLALMGYLTLPSGREPKNLPLVVLPHGGPAARDTAGFDYWAQAIASRGYAVFQPQFRGSNGFGKEFLEAGYGEWGRKMQTDVSDGARFLAERGTIDPTRTCIVGASYGGYVALAGMTLESGLYRCAVSVAGVSDLRVMLQEEQRQGARGNANPAVRYWSRFMGASGVGDTSLDALSPARLADRVKGPILLIHGRQDTIVPFSQSQIMADALGTRGRLVPLDGEDHYLSTAATRQQMLTETVAFLEQNNPPD